MKLPRRKFLHLAPGAAALPAVSRIAWAQTYPSQPVRIIVGLPAGTATDILARLVGQSLSERLGKQFIVENRPGAAGNIATEVVMRASPDGYTLLQVNSGNAVNASLYANLNFNFIRDITPVACIARTPFVMVVNPSSPAKTVPEFIAYAKANPGKINMASPGIGSANHIFGASFAMRSFPVPRVCCGRIRRGRPGIQRDLDVEPARPHRRATQRFRLNSQAKLRKSCRAALLAGSSLRAQPANRQPQGQTGVTTTSRRAR